MSATHYDVVIIGAGMSGLAAGIRLAYFGKRVCIVERHYAYGGLNSYYRLDGREFDVGLHAVTNFAPPNARHVPLNRVLRQLRISRDEWDMCAQLESRVRFPGRYLRFSNDPRLLTEEVAREFPRFVDRFHRLVDAVTSFDADRLDIPYRSTRAVLNDLIADRTLIDMLLCPLLFYGSAEEHDMDFTQFVILFRSIYLEGFWRPRGGVRTILRSLVKHYRGSGGQLKMQTGVNSIDVQNGRARAITLSTGETLTAEVVLSSAGMVETLRLCRGLEETARSTQPGRISFVETVLVMDVTPASLGHASTIVFYSDREPFAYRTPEEVVDRSSGILCCPNNYADHDDGRDGVFRITWLANHDRWAKLGNESYTRQKQQCLEYAIAQANDIMPGVRAHIVQSDIFTPRTIERFTGHLHGAVYGAPVKHRDGRTPVENLFVCGTDQGYLGIIGAMVSGVTMANHHVLMEA